MIDLSGAPFPVTYRELWLPQSINNHTTLPTSVEGGHGLTFTLMARKGSTVDGVHGIPAVVTSNINLGAIHNNENMLWIKIRFKLDVPFSIASATDQYLFGKYDGVNDYLIGWLEADDGMFHMAHAEGGAVEAIVSAENTWDIGWHTILVSCHNANGQRLIVDGGAVVTQVGNMTAITLTADFVLMCRDDGVSNEGLAGVEIDVVIGNDALTAAEEADLCKGIPTTDAATTESYLLDEGRGVTAWNRGSSGAGANGTLDTSCNWKFGKVKKPILSLDGINDRADSSAGVDISSPITLIDVEKMKSTYSSLAGDHEFIYVGGAVELRLFYNQAADAINWRMSGGLVSYDVKPAIDDYLIFIGTCTPAGISQLFVNGLLIGTDTSPPPPFAPGQNFRIGQRAIGSNINPSRCLLTASAEGAFAQKQALAYSRYIKNIFNLPISI